MVIDYDHAGESGFGLVDAVQGTYARTGSDLITQEKTLFERLAESREVTTARQRTWESQRLELQIVRVGEVTEWRGDYNAAGWSVPYAYRDKYAIDWAAKIGEESVPEGHPFKRLAYVAKAWAGGTVWEFYRPNPDYAGDLESAYAIGRNIAIQRRGDAQVTVPADTVCGLLYRIVYKDGQEWVEIVDLDGTSKLQYMIRGVPDPNVVPAIPTSSGPKYE